MLAYITTPISRLEHTIMYNLVIFLRLKSLNKYENLCHKFAVSENRGNTDSCEKCYSRT